MLKFYKKLFLLLLLFPNYIIGQELLNFYLEPTENDNIVTLHTIVYHTMLTNYFNHDINIDNNIIEFNLCYDVPPLPFQIITYDEREFDINLPKGFTNFTFNINLFKWVEIGVCDFDSVPLESGLIDFNFPYNPTKKVPIPDNNFEGYLESQGFGDDTSNNNLVYLHRLINISHLWMNELDLNQLGLSQIENLSGIELLYRLKVLWCEDNLIEQFDATMHPFLERLYISNNPIDLIEVYNSLHLVALSAAQTQIGNINLNNNPRLRLLVLGSPNIDNIDVSQNFELWSLTSSGNFIESIDLSNNQFLERLTLINNINLEFINLENNNNLITFTCHENENLESVIMGNNPNITLINIHTNNQLSDIDVSGCTNLNNLIAHSNALQHLDLSTNSKLEELFIHNNPITSLDLRNGTNLFPSFILGVETLNLYCIDVSYPNDAPYGQWVFDSEKNYSENCLLGISEENIQSLISIYPNPVKDYLNLESKSSILKLGIYSLTGEKVLEVKLPTLRINTSQLKSGMYFINIKTDIGSSYRKFIKQ